MNVTIYSTPSCGYCTLAKQYFKEKNISFTDYDVSRDQTKAEEMIRKTGQYGVPVIVVNGKTIIGFNRGEIERMLAS